MKKLLYTLFLVSFLMMSACTSINSGVKIITSCCHKLALPSIKLNQPDSYDDEKNKESDYAMETSLLPVNSWDAKMLTW